MDTGRKSKDSPRLEPRVCDEPSARAYLGGVSRSTIRRRDVEGKIRSVKLDGRRLYLIESLDDYVNSGIREQGASDAAA